MRWAIIPGLTLAAIAGLAALLSACDRETEGPSPSAQTPTAERTPTPEDAAELQQLAKTSREAVTAKVSYTFSTTVGGTSEGTFKVVQRPPDSRIDFVPGGERPLSTIVIRAGGKSYVCTELGEVRTCVPRQVEPGDPQTAGFQPLLDASDAVAQGEEGIQLIAVSERTIAGLTAKCFRVKAAAADQVFQEGQVCYSEDGMLLALNAKLTTGDVSVEATEATTEVTDEDFEPPFPVTELSGY